MISGFVFASCQDNNPVEGTDVAETILEAETIALVESDDVLDEVDNIIDDFLYEDLNLSSKDEASKTDGDKFGGMPNCVVKTIVIEGTTKTVTLDFGEGCELPNGNSITGKIIMNYSFDLELQIITVIQSFDGFTFNDITVVGENTMVRMKENENGNLESTKTIDVTLIWLDGLFVSRVGTKTREWIEGFDTKTWGDNVYLITGNWTNTFKDGTVYSAEIIDALRREMACEFVVSGVLELKKGDRDGTLNFGDGSCNNIAIFTNKDGVETEIILKRRMH